MNFFYGVYPSEKKTSRLFDLARLILQPDFSRKAHITLRGPYDKRPSRKSQWFKRHPDNAILTRPNTFFSERQNTVYLGVSIWDINDLSWKRDYPDSIPHMTIYDGNDRTLAWQVLQSLRKFHWQLEIELTPVIVLERKKGIRDSFFIEIDDIDLAYSDIHQRPLSRDYLETMHIGQRIFFLEAICTEIHRINHPSSTPE